MYIFEGRGKGATWSLLLETLHNQGVYVISALNSEKHLNDFKKSTLEYMVDEKVISEDGRAYLEESMFTLKEWQMKGRRERREAPVYLDVAMVKIEELLTEELGKTPEIIALGNDDRQIVHPRQIKEMNNTFVQDSREYFGRE